ncbi:MAG: MFS transporter [Pseudomonadota bacterium]
MALRSTGGAFFDLPVSAAGTNAGVAQARSREDVGATFDATALGAGLLLALSSSFGQTFFLSLFGGVWRSDFELSHGAFGGLYGAATLASAASLIWLGKVVDHVAPSRIAIVLLTLTSVAAVWLSSAKSVYALGVGLFAMRVIGQGLLSHLAMTTIAKWFDAARGRALAIAMLGFPIGEAALPILAVAAMETLGWRGAWLAVASFSALFLAPLVFVLTSRAEKRAAVNTGPAGGNAPAPDATSWRRSDAVRDWRFYALAPGLLATPFIVTSVLFHQAHLVESKGWALKAFSSLFPIYATAATAAALFCGRMVDAFGTPRVLTYFLTPLAAGLVLLSLSGDFLAGALFMTLAGATGGMATIVYTSIWPELYGSGHLGAIRALAMSAMVLASAIGPALTGALLDAGVDLDDQLLAMSCYATLGALSLLFLRPSLKRLERPNAP